MNTSTTDTGRVRLGGALCLPAVKTATSKIALGGALRLPRGR